MTSAPHEVLAVPVPDPRADAWRRIAVTVGTSLLLVALVVALLVRLGGRGAASQPVSCAGR